MSARAGPRRMLSPSTQQNASSPTKSRARPMPFIAGKGSSRVGRSSPRSGPGAGRVARLGCGRRRRDAWLFALGQDPVTPAVDRLLLDRWQAALVVRDDQQVLELVELG